MKTFVLILMFWGGDRGTSMVAAEFNSERTCLAAKIAAENEMNSSTWFGTRRTVWAVCAEK